ncbi:MAG: hypothetical protein COA76_12000 [Moritella sp.]|nr:MAG: hypothetical protein COA76_12000 [Moritella sp.]
MNKQKNEKNSALLSLITRKNKKQLVALINETNLNKDQIEFIVSQLFPSFSDATSVYKNITIDKYKKIIDTIAHNIHTKHNSNDSEKRTKAIDQLDMLIAKTKEQRKKEVDLYIHTAKTQLTTAENEHLIAAMKSYNYKSTSSFLRDIIIKDIEIKPRFDNNALEYFKETKDVIRTLSDIKESINVNSINDLTDMSKVMSELTKCIVKTRNLAIDRHNSGTAEILAKKYLTAKKLKKLYQEKLEKENQ